MEKTVKTQNTQIWMQNSTLCVWPGRFLRFSDVCQSLPIYAQESRFFINLSFLRTSNCDNEKLRRDTYIQQTWMEKNLQVTSFHFEAERPTFGYLRTCGKGRHVGQRCTSWCSAHCGPWKKQKYAKREWKSIWQRKWFRKLWCTMVENLGNRQLVWEVGETFERCVFLMERVESVFGLFVIFYLNSRRFAVRWYVGLRQWTSR